MSLDTIRAVETLSFPPMRFSDDPEFVVFDTEWTAWEGSMARDWSGPGEYRELVQVGAVKLDALTLEETDRLELMVRPRFNPVLSDYFKDLTGIKQSRVDREGLDLPEALDRFATFMTPEGWGASNGGDDVIMRENAELYGLEFPLANATFTNLRPILVERTGIPRPRLVTGQLDSVLGFTCDLAAHDALADARKLAEALRVLRGRGQI
ncbi:inhibitor of the KinA pathway to sporulation [Paramagnetospirillum caucaseum]|uniref:Inhibitor of the KinA pathway to sporulation n=1 Tax=Paramagnetospirillum caucaseum TaxID=1244869 RepID=M3A9X3_9PROT|nr:exonuclease domain-containing protein [Paramagnetospirillum caucaseum]EME69309.1 inhibitor of the KinA pathway to sporulation [Paramagnetospirillum caucaseum]